MDRNYYTKEVRCKKCRQWFEEDELCMGYCLKCLIKLQKEIDKALGKGD